MALLTLTFAWLSLLGQHERLWQRLPVTAADRYAGDGLGLVIPERPGLALLESACGEDLSWIARLLPASKRKELAACLNEPTRLDSQVHWRVLAPAALTLLDEQILAAQAWQDTERRRGPDRQVRLRDRLRSLIEPPEQGWRRFLPDAGTPVSTRTPMGPELTPSRLSAGLAQRLDQARLDREAWAALAAGDTTVDDSGPPALAGVRWRARALRASGWTLLVDHGEPQPRAHLVSDRSSLADLLERQRRAQAHAQRWHEGDPLSGLRELPLAMALGSLLLLAVVAWRQPRAGAVLCWGAATLLPALGALLLTDLSLTGSPALRHLAARQFLDAAGVDLVLALPGGVSLWWPLVLPGPLLCLMHRQPSGLARTSDPMRKRLAVLERPVPALALGVLPAVLLCVLMLTFNRAAALSELLIGLACLGLALAVASTAAQANAGIPPSWRHTLLVAALAGGAMLTAMLRNDHGHAAIAVVLLGLWAWMFRPWLASATAGLITASLLAALLWTAQDASPVDLLHTGTHLLPAHVQERFEAMQDPFGAATSDLARVQWLMASAGPAGWGAGYVPWQGLQPGANEAGLPLQGPSDYVPALWIALWGPSIGLGLIGLALLLFCAAAVRGLRVALAPGRRTAHRALAAWGGLGCAAVATKIVLSTSGVAGLLPLTGLPVALLGYGPVANAAAAFYLFLALGTPDRHTQAGTRAKGVWRQGTGPASVGHVRRRMAALSYLLGLLIGAGLLWCIQHWAREGDRTDRPTRHLPQFDVRLRQALATSLTRVGTDVATSDVAACPPLYRVVADWNRLLEQAGHARHIDAGTLWRELATEQTPDCRSSARRLGLALERDRHSAATSGAMLVVLARQVGTRDVWWARPGCLLESPPDRFPSAAVAVGRGLPVLDCDEEARHALGELSYAKSLDPWLLASARPGIERLLQEPAGSSVVNHHPVRQGRAVMVTLDAVLQSQAERWVRCLTGHLSTCPVDERGRPAAPTAPRSDQRLRAGAMGLLLAEVDSGRVLAMAGAVSTCTRANLQRMATDDLALRSAEDCAQRPDRRNAWVLGHHPATWAVPPGSAIKPLALLSGIESGQVPRTDDERWKHILAESRLRAPVQSLALSSAKRYLPLIERLLPPRAELIAGGRSDGWWITNADGLAGLRPSTLDFEQVEAMRQEKAQGKDLDRLHPASQVRAYLDARRLADTALGAADASVSAWGLMEVWRAVDLRARGHDDAPKAHLIAGLGAATETVHQTDLRAFSADAARRVLAATSGVTASHWQGTAQGSCRRVFGHCDPQGVATLSGKTGSADFLQAEDSPHVKAGQQWPAKLFAAVFTGSDGRRYVVSAMSLRAREAGSDTLELKSSAAAEAALGLVRSLQAPLASPS
ncbi:hypothetical protein [Sphaerotilus mobilis]|nr:hypothetical protein [Sphaerotilus mobilis]